jgi:D-alanine--poly(phosphoribitol) ligase subunit 1
MNTQINTILDHGYFEEITYFDGEHALSSEDVANGTFNLLDKVSARENGVQQGVCLLMERGANYIAAIFSAWKAGFYVVPLNTSWPEHKNTDIINRIRPVAVILGAESNCVVSKEYKTINASDLFRKPKLSDREVAYSPIKPADIAYVIFTSGSTGEPKGVVISAGSFRSYIDWTKRYFHQYSTSKRLLLTSELTFDITMGDIAFALAFGTAIGVARQNTNIPSVLALIMKYEIDVLYSVPTTHLALTSFAKKKRNADLSSLKLILSGGDRFPWQLVDDYKNLTQGAHFYNVYGPTETTINCFSVRLDDKKHLVNADKPVPIGECFDSLSFVLLDETGVPGKEGELCISGPQLMMGYYGDDALSEAAFTIDPTVNFVPRQLYKTGDLAYIDDGLIYLKGRIDGLVKIRGYRIHPDEVSKVIDTLQGVDVSATVTVGKQSDAVLMAFIKLDHTIELSKAAVDIALRGKLPAYMIPADYIFIDSFPLNQSGKIDKKSLIKGLL